METAECILQCSIRQPADQARCLQISLVNEEGSSTAIASHERMEIEGELWCGGLYSKCFNSASFYLILHKWMIFPTIFLFLVHSSFRYSRWPDRSSTGYGSHGTVTGRVQCHHLHTGGYNRLHDHTYHCKTGGMVCTLTPPRLSANSPKSGETSVVVTEWMCIHMPIHNSRRCSNTSYRYDMDLGCGVKGSTASTIA